MFKKLDHWDKYVEILELIKILKQIEFKGNNIDDDFTKF